MTAPPPITGARELVLASAGSGKTFRISSRIIALLAEGEAPATVFASTFTRKAAGEILERVLVRLARAAADARRARELAAQLALSDDADAAFWTRVLAATVRRMHEFDVGTLDAFFARILRAYAHELGLPPGWRVADEPTLAGVRTRALEGVLASADPGVMIELVRGVRGHDAARSVHEALAEQVGAVAAVERALDPGAPGWNALAEALDTGAAEDGASAADLIEALERLALPTTKAGTPRAHWRNARDRLRVALAAEEWEAALRETVIQRALAGEPYAGADCDAAWQAFARRLADVGARRIGARLQSRAAALGRLARRFNASYDAALLDQGGLAFDDVTRLLGGAGGSARDTAAASAPPLARPDLSYRLDGRLRHLLLDEFQDTSLIQWRALLPLADALLGPDAPAGGSASVVADPKQSIYGWRGAAPIVVDALADRYPLEQDRLAVSWRSSQVVLDAVNRTFTGIADAGILGGGDEIDERIDRDTARAWAESFDPHTAAPRPDGSGPLPGHVRLVAGPEKAGRAGLQPELLAFCADQVAAIHASAPGRSIGVLARTRTAVARIIYELRLRGVAASEEGGTPLIDDPAVVSVLALLRLADHPGDGLSAYHVARTPVGSVVGQALDLPGDLTDETDAVAVVATSAGVRRRLVHDGYGPTLARLRDALVPHVDARGGRRLAQLVELGYRHDAEATLRSDDFVHLAESTRVESPGSDPVRVMTIHGSKGLEFDVVVLPDLHDTLVQDRRAATSPLAYRPTPTGPVSHAFPPMAGALRALFAPRVPELAAAYRAHRGAQVRDALSGLYVAMTRAKYALHLIVPADGARVGTTRSAGALLRERLTPDPERPASEGEVLFEAGDPKWARTLPAPPVPGTRPETEPPPVTLTAHGPPRRHLPRRRPSDHGGGPDTPTRPSPGPGSAPNDAARVPATVKGSVVHAWLETITWLGADAAEPLPRTLDDAGSRLGLARREAPEVPAATLEPWVDDLWARLREQLAAPEVRRILDEGAVRRTLAEAAAEAASAPYGTGGAPGTRTPTDPAPPASVVLEVLREVRVTVREGDGLVDGVIDRLVLAWRQGRVVAAQVLDWKTDAVVNDGSEGGDPLAGRASAYRGQLRDYRAAVSALFRVPEESVRGHLVFLEPGRVIEV